MGECIPTTDKYPKNGQKRPKKAKIGLKLVFYKNEPLETPQESHFQVFQVFLGVKFNSEQLLLYEI